MNDNDNNNNNNTSPTVEDEHAPLDSFEQEWIDALNRPDPELSRSGEDFVARVMQAHAEPGRSASVIGRIQPRRLPLAVAAALAMAAYLGWSLFLNGSSTPPSPPIVNQSAPVQPHSNGPVPPTERATIPLGGLIAQAQSTATRPAMGLAQVVEDVPAALNLKKLIDLVNNPVPDLNELLAPLKPTETHSRA